MGNGASVPPLDLIAVRAAARTGPSARACWTRPEFALVTGVSTDALTAPFAFIGLDCDAALKRVYIDVTLADIRRRRHDATGRTL